ncbi:hypothetical protein B566_EDAN019253, partial [Ephemera danica]
MSAGDKFELGMIIAILLVISGVEINPGPFTEKELKQLVDAIQPAITLANQEQTEQIRKEVSNIKVLVQNYEKKCTEQNTELKNEVLQLKESNKELQDMVHTQAAILRKNNILIHGIKENDNEDTPTVVHDICADLNVQLADGVVTEAFRVGRNKGQRPILCKLNSFAKKKEILDKNRSRGSNQFSIYHDLTKTDRANKKLLKPYRDQAVQRNQRAYIRGSKLIINGAPWTLDDLRQRFSDQLNLDHRDRENDSFVSPPPNQMDSNSRVTATTNTAAAPPPSHENTLPVITRSQTTLTAAERDKWPLPGPSSASDTSQMDVDARTTKRNYSKAVQSPPSSRRMSTDLVKNISKKLDVITGKGIDKSPPKKETWLKDCESIVLNEYFKFGKKGPPAQTAGQNPGDVRAESYHMPIVIELSLSNKNKSLHDIKSRGSVVPRYKWLPDEADTFTANSMKSRIRLHNNIPYTQNHWFDAECESAKHDIEKANRRRLRKNDANNRNVCRLSRLKFQELKERKIAEWKEKRRAEVLEVIAHGTPAALYDLLRKFNKAPYVNVNISADDWKNHFRKVLGGTQYIDNRFILPSFRYIDELDAPFNEYELLLAVKYLKNNKAPGIDGIPAEFYKHVIENESIMAGWLQAFNALFLMGESHAAWDASILHTIYKNKGDRNCPDNYRGIALAPILSKVYSKMLYARLQNWAFQNNKITIFQAGFRPGYSTVDNIFVLDHIIKKYLSQRCGRLYCAFIDFQKAFDTVNRINLWTSSIISTIDNTLCVAGQSMKSRIRLHNNIPYTQNHWFDAECESAKHDIEKANRRRLRKNDENNRNVCRLSRLKFQELKERKIAEWKEKRRAEVLE